MRIYHIFKSSWDILTKYTYPQVHSAAFLPGARSLHLQCCIHSETWTRLSGFPLKRWIGQCLHLNVQNITHTWGCGNITYWRCCCIIWVNGLILLRKQEARHIHLFAVPGRNEAVASHLRGRYFFIFSCKNKIPLSLVFRDTAMHGLSRSKVIWLR